MSQASVWSVWETAQSSLIKSKHVNAAGNMPYLLEIFESDLSDFEVDVEMVSHTFELEVCFQRRQSEPAGAAAVRLLNVVHTSQGTK